jgi:general secretion pathway protein E
VAAASAVEGRPSPSTAKGCPACQNTGYQGRTGIYELLLITDAVRALVLKNSDSPTIRRARWTRAWTRCATTARKVFEGHTTLEEVLAATQDEV